MYIPLINQFLDFFKRKYQLLNSEWKSIEKYQTNELLPVLNIDLHYCNVFFPVVGIQKAVGDDLIYLETISHQFLLPLCFCENLIKNICDLFSLNMISFIFAFLQAASLCL